MMQEPIINRLSVDSPAAGNVLIPVTGWQWWELEQIAFDVANASGNIACIGISVEDTLGIMSGGAPELAVATGTTVTFNASQNLPPSGVRDTYQFTIDPVTGDTIILPPNAVQETIVTFPISMVRFLADATIVIFANVAISVANIRYTIKGVRR